MPPHGPHEADDHFQDALDRTVVTPRDQPIITHNHHSHGHGHDHQHGEETPAQVQKRVRTKLVWATVFALTFMGVEIVGGIIAGSLAIVTDAAHLFTDVANFITAIMASHLAEQGPSLKLSYGLVRAEVLSALINTGVIVLLAGYLVYEGIRRIMSWVDGTAAPIDGRLMMIIAVVGVVFNIVLMLIFGHEHDHGHGGHDHGHHHHHHAGYKPVVDDSAHSHAEEGRGGHNHHDHDHDHEEENGKHDHHHDHDDDHDDHDHDHHHEKEGEAVKLLEPKAKVSTGTTASSVAVSSYGSVQEAHANHDHNHHNHAHDADHDHNHHHAHSHAPPTNGGRDKKKKKAKKNINLEAAHLHVITDLVQSVGVAIAGVIIYFKPDWQIVDPIVTILFSIVIVFSTIKMLTKTMHVLLEGVPDGIDPEVLRGELRAIPGVTDVHDLHIWMLSIDRPVVTVHLKASDPDPAMKQAHRIFAMAGITHVTVQIQKDTCEPDDCEHPCPTRACKVPGQCS